MWPIVDDCRFPQVGIIWCNQRRAKLAVLLVFVSSIVVCIPNSINITVLREPLVDVAEPLLVDAHTTYAPPPSENSTCAFVWKVVFKLDTEGDRFVHGFNFWTQTISDGSRLKSKVRARKKERDRG